LAADYGLLLAGDLKGRGMLTRTQCRRHARVEIPSKPTRTRPLVTTNPDRTRVASQRDFAPRLKSTVLAPYLYWTILLVHNLLCLSSLYYMFSARTIY
jgi:hypothetical protein